MDKQFPSVPKSVTEKFIDTMATLFQDYEHYEKTDDPNIIIIEELTFKLITTSNNYLTERSISSKIYCQDWNKIVVERHNQFDFIKDAQKWFYELDWYYCLFGNEL